MKQRLKSAAVLLAAINVIAATPESSSAGLFPWLYDALFAPSGYPFGWGVGYGGYGGYGYGAYYPPTGYQTAFYAPAGLFNGCGCNPCCECVAGCSPCGAGGCASGNCQMTPLPKGAQPTPIPEQPQRTEPDRSTPRRTFGTEPETAPEAPVYEPPLPRTRGSSSAPGTRAPAGTRTLPEDDFVPPTRRPMPPERTSPAGEPAASGAAASPAGRSSGGFDDFGADPEKFSAPSTSKRIDLGPAETTIPARKPAEAEPVKETAPNSESAPEAAPANDQPSPNLEDRSTARPIIMRERLVRRASEHRVQLAGQPPRFLEWSARETFLARQ